MLALTRRPGQSVIIGDPRNPLGSVRVVEVNGDRVRLSFDFHKSVEINREELAKVKVKR